MLITIFILQELDNIQYIDIKNFMDLDYIFNMSNNQDYDLNQCINILHLEIEIFVGIMIRVHSSITSAFPPKFYTGALCML